MTLRLFHTFGLHVEIVRLLRTPAPLALCCLFPLAARLQAQPPAVGAVIRGRVLDSLGEPIANAEAALDGTPRRTISSGNGAFALKDISVGSYRLSIRRIGFEPVTLDAHITGSDTLDVDVVLARTVNTLDSVRVTAPAPRLADFEANRRLGFGTFFPREDLERQAGSVLHTLLRAKLNGFSYRERPCGGMALASATVSARSRLDGPTVVGVATGCTMPDLCYVQLYVDGIRVFGTNHVSEPPNINEYRLEELEAVEVYGSSAATPARYNAAGAVCGTLVLWRRQ